jgi:hypothetical protein
MSDEDNIAALKQRVKSERITERCPPLPERYTMGTHRKQLSSCAGRSRHDIALSCLELAREMQDGASKSLIILHIFNL